MDEQTEIVKQALGSSLRRRDFLTKAAAAGAVAWATPVILSQPAFGLPGVEGTPGCEPTVRVCCTRYFCNQGNKYFPGIAVAISNCPCASGTCGSACVMITNITHTAGNGVTVVAYGPGTTCGPGGNDVGNVFSDGAFHCLTASQSTIFFGKQRVGGGAIGDIGGAQVCFDLVVWASCPDNSSQNGPTSVCQSHRYCVTLDSMNMPACSCDNPSGPAAGLCGGVGFAPCPSCGPAPTCSSSATCPPSAGTPADPSPIQSTPIPCPSPAPLA